MTVSDIIAYRLINQQIAETSFTKPNEIVSWLVAMQAQEFAMAKWAIGLRLPRSKDTDIEKAFNEGSILRTHLMRPTWHFVTPADIRWLITLTAPHVNAISDYYYRQHGLDNKIFKRSNDVLIKSLEGGKQLTRTELQAALKQRKIVAGGPALGHIMMHAELDGIICSGARRGKQFTYALLDERAPNARILDKEEALAELMRRYFASRGPATLQDFIYWSGLTMKDARKGAEALGNRFTNTVINGKEYIFIPSVLKPAKKLHSTFLMPDYDEYGMSYKDRSALMSKQSILPETSDGTFSYWLIINGKAGGHWKRTVKNKGIDIKTVPNSPLNKTKQQAVLKAVKRYKLFSAETKQ